MMKITVSCKVCGKILAIAEKEQVNDADLELYQQQSSCEEDGPFLEYDEETGEPLPKDNSNILAIKTLV